MLWGLNRAERLPCFQVFQVVTVMLVSERLLWREGTVVGYAIGGSAEKWQIHTQNSHFWRLVVTVDFDDISVQKVWSVDHVIIVMFINGYAIGGLQKSGKSIRKIHTFGG